MTIKFFFCIVLNGAKEIYAVPKIKQKKTVVLCSIRKTK